MARSRSSTPSNQPDLDDSPSRSSTPATQLAQDADLKRMLKIRDKIVRRKAKRDLKLKALAVPSKSKKPLAAVFRERRKRGLATKARKTRIINTNDEKADDDKKADDESMADDDKSTADDENDKAGANDEEDEDDPVSVGGGSEAEVESVVRVQRAVVTPSADGRMLIRIQDACEGCLASGSTCFMEKGSRDRVCTNCKRRKKRCSIKGVVGRLIATGGLATVEESINFKVSSREDVIGLGLERGSELVLLQLLSFQQEMEDRLGAIERRLCAIENGGDS